MKLEVKPVGHGPFSGVLSFHLDVTGSEDLAYQEKLIQLSKGFVELKKRCPHIKLAVISCFDELKPIRQEGILAIRYTLKSNGFTLMGITSPAYQQQWLQQCDFRVFSGTLEAYQSSLGGLVNEYLVDDSPEDGLLELPSEGQSVFYNRSKVRDFNKAIEALSGGQKHSYGFFTFKEMV